MIFFVRVELVEGVIALFAHYAVEFFLRNLGVSRFVGFSNHVLELLVGQMLSNLLGDLLKVQEGDSADLVGVENIKDLSNFFFGILLSEKRCHHFNELF